MPRHRPASLARSMVALAAAVFALCGRARADAVDIALAKEDLVLTGRESSAAVTLTIASDEEVTTPVTLKLDWQASELVKLDSSTLSVRVNETPARSTSLAQAGPGEHAGSALVSLGVLPPGFHRVSIEAHLDVPGEPCRVEHERETWLRILASSRVRYARKAAPASAITIATLTDRWAAARAPATVALVDIGDRTIGTSERALANLEADFMLRKLGIAPTRDAATSEHAWLLATASDPNVDQAPWSELREAMMASEPTQAVAQLIGGRLHMLARTDAALRDAVRAFAEPSLRALCEPELCRFGAPAPNAASSELTTMNRSAASELTVLRLGESGFPHGFLARGLGDHVLRFGWHRPPAFEVRGWPVLHLELRGPDDAGLQHSGSHVRVELNDTPIASYALERVGSNVSRLEIRIPEEHWDDPHWAFAVHTRLLPSAGQPCALVDTERFWMVIGAASSLDVPRTEPRATGLARLHREAGRAVPALAWRGPFDASALAVLGAVAFPMREQRPLDALRAALVPGECEPFCFGITSKDELARGGLALRGNEQLVWENSAARAPLLDAASALFIARIEREGRDFLAVAVAVAATPMLIDALEAPQLAGLPGDQAVFHDGRWSGLPGTKDVAQRIDVRAPEVAAAAPPGRTPQEESLLYTFDIIWAVALLVCLSGLAFFMVRRARWLRSTS